MLFGAALLLLSVTGGPLTAAAPAAFLVGAMESRCMTGTTTIVQLKPGATFRGGSWRPTVLIWGQRRVRRTAAGWIADTFGARLLMVIGGVACLMAASLACC